MPRLNDLRLLLLAAAASLLLIVRATPPDQHIEIPGVPPLALERAGTTFLRPNGTPAINEEQARSVAMTEAITFGLPIERTVLVRLVDVNAVPPVDQLVWVNLINLTAQPDPFPSGPFISQDLSPTGNFIPEGAQPEPIRATPEPLPPHTYHLIFVDANTGEYMYAYSG
ncbi:MAG TPA: hypothetical protein VGR43_06365 [Dehalococcoidia bacterium]|jgi:hypothetical protein|nr:hypothetical protein [Dehalococcoidia bacterium]